MTQRDRDRLVVPRKAQKKLITQRQAAAELEMTARQVRFAQRRRRATKRSSTGCGGGHRTGRRTRRPAKIS